MTRVFFHASPDQTQEALRSLEVRGSLISLRGTAVYSPSFPQEAATSPEMCTDRSCAHEMLRDMVGLMLTSPQVTLRGRIGDITRTGNFSFWFLCFSSTTHPMHDTNT